VLGPINCQYLSQALEQDGRTGSCSGNEHRSLLIANYERSVIACLPCHRYSGRLFGAVNTGLSKGVGALRTYQLHES